MPKKGGGHLLECIGIGKEGVMKVKEKHGPTAAEKGIRLWIQIIFAALTNGYVNGFLQSKIYTGPTKAICVPGLNCYSCPGALGSCPIGSLQAVIGSRNYQFSFTSSASWWRWARSVGGSFAGSSVPSGWYRTCFIKSHVPKLKKLPGEKYLKYLKYVVLTVFVLMLPMFVNIIGQEIPGSVSGSVLLARCWAASPWWRGNPDLQAAIGWLFDWKVFLLLSIVVLSMFTYRPFCKFLCPLGAIYGIFNPISLYHLRLDEDNASTAVSVKRPAKWALIPGRRPTAPECIRCGDCVRACPTGALSKGFRHR